MYRSALITLVSLPMMTCPSAAIAQAKATATATANTKTKTPPTKAEKLEANWEKQKTRFADIEKRSQSALARKFDDVLAQVRANRMLLPQVQANMLRRVINQKEAFLNDKKLPTCEEMLGALIWYETELHKARTQLLVAYTQLSDQYVKLKDDKKVIALADEKTRLDKSIAGGGAFKPNTAWHGARHNPDGSNADFHLAVWGFDGNVFSGSAAFNNGLAEIKVNGIVEGNRIHIETHEVVKGGKIRLVFDGFILERRMVLEISGLAANGKPARGFVSLSRQ